MKNGPYIMVKAPESYPGRTYRGTRRYVYEHHLVWWQETGDVVPDGFVIHHKNDDKHDNRILNLELKTRADHTSDHSRAEPVPVVCGWCERRFTLPPATYRRRRKAAKTDDLYCSRSCGKTASWDRGDPH